jgi:CheY-like chemotaxis protein
LVILPKIINNYQLTDFPLLWRNKMDEKISRPLILAVDDVPVNLKLIKTSIKSFCDVETADNGIKAMESIASGPLPDLILLDIMMPLMDGYEVCEKLKADSRTSKIPIIFVTGKSSSFDELRGFELGAVDYITKPFRPAIVSARVRTHLKLARTIQDLHNLSEESIKQEQTISQILNTVPDGLVSINNSFEIGMKNQSSDGIFPCSEKGKCHELLGNDEPCEKCPASQDFASSSENIKKGHKMGDRFLTETISYSQDGKSALLLFRETSDEIRLITKIKKMQETLALTNQKLLNTLNEVQETTQKNLFDQIDMTRLTDKLNDLATHLSELKVKEKKP